ncbi:TatD family hydrolase [Candidatus Dependentiae bacterium]|nr:TatD family hydrolase [Candidatus Dependentiae bacterium]
MLVDTHCHINTIIKKDFDVPLPKNYVQLAQQIIDEATQHKVTTIINVGTSLQESIDCVSLAQCFKNVWATVGLHPNDCTSNWINDFKKIKALVHDKQYNNIVGIGECGMDFHYPEYNVQRQKDVFKAHIELALENNLALVIHTREAPEETLGVLSEYASQISRGVIHCFSEKQDFANQVIDWGFILGIGGTLTYPKNNYLRDIAQNVSLKKIVLETDAPFLPIQAMRGKKNHPKYIAEIAQFLANLRNESLYVITKQTTYNALRLFNIS